MKKILYSFLFLSIVCSLYSCGGGDTETEETAADLTEETVDEQADAEVEVEEEPAKPFEGKTAIALRSSALSDKPGGKEEKVKYIKNFSFGNKFEMVGDCTKIGRGEYFKLKLNDGTVGWASTWSIAPDAKIGVVTGSASIYKSPDITSVTSDKLEVGEMIVLLNNDMEIGFNEFYTSNKGKKGWIKAGNGLSEDATDLELAILIGKASDLKDPNKKLTSYNEILENTSYASSPLYEGLAKKKAELEFEIENSSEGVEDVLDPSEESQEED